MAFGVEFGALIPAANHSCGQNATINVEGFGGPTVARLFSNLVIGWGGILYSPPFSFSLLLSFFIFLNKNIKKRTN
jgi:hypothetical protein